MDNKGKPESLTISDKINISVQVDAHDGTNVCIFFFNSGL
jgi:hypothetical protein